MATYTSNLYASGLPTLTAAGDVTTLRQVFAATIPAGTVTATNDIIKLAPIPLNYKVTNWYLDVPGLDQSAGLVTRLGDYTHSNGIYATGLTLGRTSTEGYVMLGGTGTTGGTVAFWFFGVPLALGFCAFFIWLIWFKRWQTAT